MKILHVTDGIPPDYLGGTGQVVRELALEQTKHGHQVGILTASDAGPRTEDAVQIFTLKPLPRRFVHYRSVFSKKRGNEVMDVIRSFKPDLIHVHTIAWQVGYTWIKEASSRGIVMIASCHDVSHIAGGKVTGRELSILLTELKRSKWQWNPVRNFFIRRALYKTDGVLSVSAALADYLGQHRIAPVRVMHNGINTTFWKPELSKAEVRKMLNLPENETYFLLAGRLGHDKGSTLIAATLPENAHLLLAGSGFGDLFSKIEQRTHVFPNQTPDAMRTLYSACDAVLVPSRCLDCFPTVCLEAMAMERAVIATSWGGAKESVVNDKTGWILDPYDTEGWRTRMSWCTAHTADLELMGKLGRERVEKEFTVAEMAEALESIYKTVLSA